MRDWTFMAFTGLRVVESDAACFLFTRYCNCGIPIPPFFNGNDISSRCIGDTGRPKIVGIT